MAELQSRIVDRDTFWERYFFRVHRLREELQTAEEAATEETAATDEGAAMDPAAEGTSAQSNPLSPDADSIASSGQANASAHSTPSRMSSATVERPAPIARQRACGAQRKAEESATAAPHPLPFCRRCALVAASLPAGGWLRAPFRPPCPYGCVHARTHARVGTRIRTREELCQVRFIYLGLSLRTRYAFMCPH